MLAIALAAAPTASWAQEQAQPAYTTGHPGKNLPWLGLATPDGRYEVLLSDGCDAIAADMNVLLARSDDSNEAMWSLQVPDSDQVCSVAEWHWMGNQPCFTNEAGDCIMMLSTPITSAAAHAACSASIAVCCGCK
jgi:hypothetical protein